MSKVLYNKQKFYEMTHAEIFQDFKVSTERDDWHC